jgi:hypothetical protein
MMSDNDPTMQRLDDQIEWYDEVDRKQRLLEPPPKR